MLIVLVDPDRSGRSRSFWWIRHRSEGPGARGASGLFVFARILCVAAAAIIVSGCIPWVHRGEIARDRAIEIARAQVSFQPDTVAARRTSSGGRAVWRITFRGRLPNQPP